MFTVVWLVVDFREKEDKAPPPASSLPDAAKSDYAAKMTAYILAWFGESPSGEAVVLSLFQLTGFHDRLSLLDFATRVLPRRLVPQTGPRGECPCHRLLSCRSDIIRCCRASRSPRS